MPNLKETIMIRLNKKKKMLNQVEIKRARYNECEYKNKTKNQNKKEYHDRWFIGHFVSLIGKLPG